MTTAQVVEHLGYPTRQCPERRLAKDPRHAGHMAKPIIPLETKDRGDRTGAGRHARKRAAERFGAGAAGRRRGLFLRTSTTSRINAFSSSSSSTLRRKASASSSSAADGRRRESAGLLPCAEFLFLGCNAAMPPLRYALTQPCTAPTPAPSLFGGLLLHATRHQLDCPSPCLQWDDGFGHMAGIPGIHRQPTLQALPGRITQMLHHLGRRHRRGEIQPHRTLSFLKTGHTKIFPFGLQENVRSPQGPNFCALSDSRPDVRGHGPHPVCDFHLTLIMVMPVSDR